MIHHVLSRVQYRIRQFLSTLFPQVDAQLLQEARSHLPESWQEIFDQLRLSEKAHILRLYRKILENKEFPDEWRQDLIILALCHDFGKTLTRPSLPEKIIKALLPIPNRAHPILGGRILRKLHAPKKLVKRVTRHHAHPGDDALLAFFQNLDDSC